jgi:hypothetical protein
MCTMKDGKHALPHIPDGTSFAALIEGDWKFYSVSPQRAAKKTADNPSYMWDWLIEYQSSFIRAGIATSLPGLNPTASDHERIVRALADEPGSPAGSWQRTFVTPSPKANPARNSLGFASVEIGQIEPMCFSRSLSQTAKRMSNIVSCGPACFSPIVTGSS